MESQARVVVRGRAVRRRTWWSVAGGSFPGFLLLAALNHLNLGPLQAEAGKAPATPPPTPELTLSERVNVVGSAEVVREIPGSAHFLGKAELEEQNYTDIHRILQLLPGINIQEEDGYGLRPNIGLRGTGVERSQKITLMEDGVLIAPAPYTAPAAYYFPTAGRMESVEVRKGSAAIRQGPYTNGGAINLLSASVPSNFAATLDLSAGEHSTSKVQGLVGDSSDRFGWLVQTFQLDTEGFKELDGGGDTGVDLEDYLVKLRTQSAPQSGGSQILELKLGKTEQFGNETYLGLTDGDFALTPLRRYAASALDTITTDHEQAQLRYFVMPSPRLDFTTTVYYNDFFRDWFKNERTRGTSNRSVLVSPQRFADEVGILRGELDSDPGDLELRHNRRNYYSRGAQSVVGLAFEGGGDHQLSFGVRYHEDEEDRFQENDLYQMLGGRLLLTELGAPGSQTNRVARAEALALFVEDRIVIGRFSLAPGLRFESIDYTRLDYSRGDPQRLLGPTRLRRNRVDVLIPGVGLAYDLGGGQRLFVGAHRGFSPPGAGQNEETQEEESLNFELGYRRVGGRLGAEVTVFRSDYDNLLGLETTSGGGGSTGELFNGGEVLVEGLESSLSYDFRPSGGRYSIPLRVSYTYTSAEFRSSFSTSFADWAPFVERGDALPYLPENQVALKLGWVGGKVGVHLATSWLGAMRTNAGQGPVQASESTDARWVMDLSGDWRLSERLRLYGQVRNLADEAYIVSRRPYGVRPGLARELSMGVKLDF